jgi:hypothetical protein
VDARPARSQQKDASGYEKSLYEGIWFAYGIQARGDSTLRAWVLFFLGTSQFRMGAFLGSTSNCAFEKGLAD